MTVKQKKIPMYSLEMTEEEKVALIALVNEKKLALGMECPFVIHSLVNKLSVEEKIVYGKKEVPSEAVTDQKAQV